MQLNWLELGTGALQIWQGMHILPWTVKQDDIMDMFANAVCEVIGKVVVQPMNNGGANPPQPPPNKKPKVASKTPQPEE
jgi:hypothetical protein